jgi:hypothetical protein
MRYYVEARMIYKVVDGITGFAITKSDLETDANTICDTLNKAAEANEKAAEQKEPGTKNEL